jgi:hypothetical protein
MVEQPYDGRAQISKHIGGVTVVIPTAKQWGVIIFLCFWLVMWLIGLTFSTGFLGFGGFDGMFPVGLFMVVWLAGWIFGGVFALRMLYWMLAGQEIITAENGLLTIRYKGLLFAGPKSYELGSVKGLRVFDDGISSAFGFLNNRAFSDMMAVGKRGVIRFDYGRKTVKFADGIDEAEGKYIIDELKDAGVISAEQVM